MTKTVVAIFNSNDEANSAKKILLANGFDHDQIDISNGSSYSKTEDTHESGISRFFKNLFGDNEDEQRRYTHVAERGTVVTVHAASDEEARDAVRLLDENGAVDVDNSYQEGYAGTTESNSGYAAADRRLDDGRTDADRAAVTGENYGTGRTGTDYATRDERYDDSISDTDRIGVARENEVSESGRTNADYATRNQAYDDSVNDTDRIGVERQNENYPTGRSTGDVIPVIEEDIKVGKREVITGGVRVRSRIVEKPVEENLRLREEHVRVERNKVDRPATEEELSNFKSASVELIEHAEVADVRKSSKVVEEVSLSKDVDHRDETIRDTVRKTEVDVEDVTAENRRGENTVL